MSAAQDRLKEIFGRALALPVPDRDGFLQTACEGNATLEDEVRDLLIHHAEAAEFLEGELHLFDLDAADLADPGSVVTDGPYWDSSVPPFNVGRLVAGRYRLKSLIGEGGSGLVFRAVDELTSKDVAVKFLRHSDAKTLGTLRREVAALRYLRLPGVVQMLDEGSEGGRPFLVMSLIEGHPFPGPGGRRSWERMAGTTTAFLEALSRIHWARVVHGDLKPANVLVDRSEQPTILDLGISWGPSVGWPQDPRRTVCGTPKYLSPEQLRGEPATVLSDLYAVGVMLFESLAGAPPFPGATLEEVMEQRLEGGAPPLLSVAPDVPERVARVVDYLLRSKPAERPGTVDDVLAFLRPTEAPEGIQTAMPWLGDNSRLQVLIAAARAGESKDLHGRKGLGKTRHLAELRSVLTSEGRPCRGVSGTRFSDTPLSALAHAGFHGAPDGDDADEAILRSRVLGFLADGSVLLVDDADALDDASARIIEEVRGAGCVIRTFTGTTADGLSLLPLTRESLGTLFHGPDRVLHLREDASRELWSRTGGVPSYVAEVVSAWVRSGLASWSDGRLRIRRGALDRLRQGLWPNWSGPIREGLTTRQMRLLSFVYSAGPFGDLTTICAALETRPDSVEEDLGRLESGGWVVRLPGDRFVARALPFCLGEEDDARIFDSLASASPRATEARFFFLIASGRREDVAREAVALAERLRREGQLGRAFVIVKEGLIASRNGAEPSIESQLLEELLVLAFEQGTSDALDEALYEFARATNHSRRLQSLEQLLRGALLAAQGNAERARSLLESIGAVRSPRLERWRWSARLVAAHSLPRDAEEVVLKDATEWASRYEDPEITSACAGWLGWYRYRQGRFAEAAEQHAVCAGITARPHIRILAALNGASAWMEAFELDKAAAMARKAESEARQLRNTLFEARAQWLRRCVSYRRARALDADLELVEAVSEIGSDNLVAAISLTEAAFAWRGGDLEEGRSLAMSAVARWKRLGNECSGALAYALAVACGEKATVAQMDRIARSASRCAVPEIGVQALGLLASAHPARAADRLAAAQGLIKRSTCPEPDTPLDVLSFKESLRFLAAEKGVSDRRTSRKERTWRS